MLKFLQRTVDVSKQPLFFSVYKLKSRTKTHVAFISPLVRLEYASLRLYQRNHRMLSLTRF